MSSSILNEHLFASFEASIRDINNAEMLPPVCYTNAEFHEFEKDAIFNREWLCVGRESWAREPGEFFTTTHAGEPIVVVRNRHGELKAFSTVCQHRAMLVAEGHGRTKTFLCPYHHWVYSLDGQLIGAPAMDRACDFDKKQVRLPEFRLEVWLGFVFINFDPDALPLGPRLEPLRNAVANYKAELADGPRPDGSTTYPWNWKVMFENNNDGYHANRLHRGMHDVIPSALCRFPELPPDTAGYFRWNGTTNKDGAVNPLQRCILRIFPDLTEPQRHEVIFANVPPTLTLGFRSDQVSYFILHAEGPEVTVAEQGVLYAPGAMEEPLFEERRQINVQSSVIIGAQDRHVDTLVQRGLRSRYAIRGRYSWQEQTHREFNKWLVDRYRDTWHGRKGAQLRAAE
ncbi:MAG: aromatic ring-hydroxylating dioxygenase subunit alpha [Acetobacteraceae bacterium]|jgi:phenylpropionate dioxygenase-like ring-hydroxylating dioxygenase large terminal subunit